MVDERVRRVGDAAPGAAHAPAEGDVLPEVLRCDPGAEEALGPGRHAVAEAPAASNAARVTNRLAVSNSGLTPPTATVRS